MFKPPGDVGGKNVSISAKCGVHVSWQSTLELYSFYIQPTVSYCGVCLNTGTRGLKYTEHLILGAAPNQGGCS